MRFMKPEIRSPGRMSVLSRRMFQPSLSNVSQSRSTTSVRFRASSEESSPQAYETKISGLPLKGSSGRAVICSWFRPWDEDTASPLCEAMSDNEGLARVGPVRGKTEAEDETNAWTRNLLVCSILGA